MELRIGNYILSKRTEYSKVRLLDAETKEDVTKKNKELVDTIFDEYTKQIKTPDEYFEINGNSIDGLKDAANSFNNVFIPSGVVRIERLAFNHKDLVRINIPDTVKFIGTRTFCNCSNLKELYLPDSVESLGISTFEQCCNLESVKLSNNIKGLYFGLFANCNSLKNIDLPDSIRTMDDYAFGGCANLTDIKLPKNLETLGNFTFKCCEKLSNINFPKHLEYIGKQCFSGCNSLKEVILPYYACLDEGVFKSCQNLKFVILPENIIFLPNETFCDCISLNKTILPNSIQAIGDSVFKGTQHLKNINIPKNLTSIIRAPFESSSIESLTFNYDLKALEVNSGYDLLSKSQINKLIIDKSVKKITLDAFRFSGKQVTEIEYLGSKEQFEEFKKNNENLFECYFLNVKNIKFAEIEMDLNYINELSI